MAWFRSAMSMAVEVGNNNNLTRAVKNYADSVVHHAKIIQGRMGGRNVWSVKQTIKRLEDAAVSYRGPERVELLRRCLAVLKDIERFSGSLLEEKENNVEQNQASDNSGDSRRSPSMGLYYDPEVGGRPINFRDVFLHSQTLEGITLSTIVTTFSVVDNIKAHLYSQQDHITRKDGQKEKDLIEEIDILRSEFESVDRPILEIETPTALESPRTETPPRTSLEHSMQETFTHKVEETKQPKLASQKTEPVLDTEAELAKLESEFGKLSHDYSAEEIGNREFNELERE